MPQSEPPERELEDLETTRIVGALVFATTIEDFAAIKKRIAATGGTVIFQKMAIRGAKLWIVESPERPSEAVGKPREVGR